MHGHGLRRCVRCGAVVKDRRALVPKFCPECGQRMASQQWDGPTAKPRRATGAVSSVVLGIFSLCAPPIGILFGVFAIGLGISARGDIKRSNGMLTGDPIAIAGICLGSLGSLFSIMFCANL